MNRVPAGEAFEVDDVGSVEHRDLNVFVGGFVEILEEGQGRLAQADAPGCQRPELPQP